MFLANQVRQAQDFEVFETGRSSEEEEEPFSVNCIRRRRRIVGCFVAARGARFANAAKDDVIPPQSIQQTYCHSRKTVAVIPMGLCVCLSKKELASWRRRQQPQRPFWESSASACDWWSSHSRWSFGLCGGGATTFVPSRAIPTVGKGNELLSSAAKNVDDDDAVPNSAAAAHACFAGCGQL